LGEKRHLALRKSELIEVRALAWRRMSWPAWAKNAFFQRCNLYL
jgi:hypothetical protein